jgi:hypothetical protein
VKIGIETDRGPWVAALVASGYLVYAINPLQSAASKPEPHYNEATAWNQHAERAAA